MYIAESSLDETPNHSKLRGILCPFDKISKFDTPLSVNDYKLFSDLEIYPNPASDYIRVSGLTKIESYKVYNVLGSIVGKGFVSDSEKIRTNNLYSGVYILRFDTGNTLKFFKK